MARTDFQLLQLTVFLAKLISSSVQTGTVFSVATIIVLHLPPLPIIISPVGMTGPWVILIRVRMIGVVPAICLSVSAIMVVVVGSFTGSWPAVAGRSPGEKKDNFQTNEILHYLSLFTGGGRVADWEGDLEPKDRLRWPEEFSGLECSLGESWPFVVSVLLLRSLVNTEEVVIFIRRNSWELSCGLRKSIPFSSNFSAIEIILRASCWSVGGWSEEREVKLSLRLPPSLTRALSSVRLTTLSTTVSFSSRLSAFLPQFSLARSGGIPVPPLSTDQGAFPAGQGYSWNIKLVVQSAPAPALTLPRHFSLSWSCRSDCLRSQRNVERSSAILTDSDQAL